MSNQCPEAQTLIIANSKTLCFDSPKEQCSNKYPQFGTTANWSASSTGICILAASPTPLPLIIRNGNSSSPCTIGQVYICSSASPVTGTASCLCAGTGNESTTTLTERASSKSASCDSALTCFFADSLPLFLTASAAVVIVVVVLVFCLKRLCCPAISLCPSRKGCIQKILCCFCRVSTSHVSSNGFTGSVSTLTTSTTQQHMMDSDANNLAAILKILRPSTTRPSTRPSSTQSSASIHDLKHHIPALDLQLKTWRSNPLHPHALESGAQQRRLSVTMSEKSSLDLGTRTMGISLHTGERRLSISALTEKDLANVEQVTRIALRMITELEKERTQERDDGQGEASPRSIEIIDTPRSI